MGVGESLAAIGPGGSHLRLIGQARNTVRRTSTRSLRRQRCCVRSERAVRDIVDVALDTIDALNHADDRGRHQPDDDPEQKTQAQGSSTTSGGVSFSVRCFAGLRCVQGSQAVKLRHNLIGGVSPAGRGSPDNGPFPSKAADNAFRARATRLFTVPTAQLLILAASS